jgi:hypothetical protein
MQHKMGCVRPNVPGRREETLIHEHQTSKYRKNFLPQVQSRLHGYVDGHPEKTRNTPGYAPYGFRNSITRWFFITVNDV